MAPDAAAERLHLPGRGEELELGRRNLRHAGLREQVLVVVDDRAADDARQAVELALVHALRDRVRDELGLRRPVRRGVEPFPRVQHLEHALRSEARQVGARLVADVERVRPGVVRGVGRALDVPRDDRVDDLRTGLLLEGLQQLRDHVLLVVAERSLRELERDAVERFRAARHADARGSDGGARECPGSRHGERDACRLLEELAPALACLVRRRLGRQRIVAAFTQIVHSNLLLHPGLARCPGRSEHPLAGGGQRAILCTEMQRSQVESVPFHAV